MIVVMGHNCDYMQESVVEYSTYIYIAHGIIILTECRAIPGYGVCRPS